MDQDLYIVHESNSSARKHDFFAWIGQELDAERLSILLLLLVLAGVAAWLRMRHLGSLALFHDEGMQALAVQAILDHGIPRMGSGSIYLRGPLYLYMQAVLTSVFAFNPFWLRLPSVIWGVAAIFPTYVLGKTLINRPVGVLSAMLIALSIWEIELSRYARVYIAFQFFFLVSLIFFYRGFLLDERKSRIGFLVVALLTCLTHELSQLLITLFVIPLFYAGLSWKRKQSFGLWALGLGAVVVLTNRFNTIYLPESGALADPVDGEAVVGLLEQVRHALGIPALNFPAMSFFGQTLQHTPGALTALGAVAIVATVYLGHRWWRKGDSVWQVLWATAMVWAALGYQFGLVVLFLVLAVAVSERGLQALRAPPLRVVMGTASVMLGGWLFLLVRGTELTYKELGLVLFGFPDIYGYFLSWLVEGWPVMTVLLAVGSTVLFMRLVENRHNPVPIFLLGALYIPALAASLFESYPEPRYTLHLYPLVVIIFTAIAWSAFSYVWCRFGPHHRTSRYWSAILAVPIVIFITSDANLLTAWKVGERTYKSEKDPIRNVITWHFYSDFHQDNAGPSRFVKEHITDEDKVLVVGPDYTVSLYHLYVGRVDYVVAPHSVAEQYGLVDRGRRIHYLTASEFISDQGALHDVIQKYRGALWLLGDRRILSERNGYYPTLMRDTLRALAQHPDYVGRDGITFAVKVRAGDRGVLDTTASSQIFE